MRFNEAADAFLADWQAEGRLRSPNSITSYRRVLDRHSEDIGNRDPSKTGKADVKRTLGRWHGNSRRHAHSVLNTFYTWCEQEGIRETNPARQVRSTRKIEPTVFRPTREEVIRLLDASQAIRRERWVIHLGLLAGFRRAEFVVSKGGDFSRDGFIRIFGKGQKVRWVPVLPELVPVVAEIRLMVPQEAYVFGRRITVDPGTNREMVEVSDKSASPVTFHKIAQRVGRKAGMPVDIGAHTLRHAFATHVARYAGLRAAQELMGHVSVQTTEGYTERVSLDELAVSVSGFRYRHEQTRLPIRSETRA
jgi:site-specific recombinase XerD